MFLKVQLSLLLLAVVVNCEPPSTSYGIPFTSNNNNNHNFNPPSNNYGTPNNNNFGGSNGYHDTENFNPTSSYYPSHHSEDNGHDHSEPKSYEFGYAVKDDYTGNDYKRRETSDGNQVNGEYRVQLPDGRTQIVTYYADWKTGFHADVRYEGTANYPEHYNTGNGYHGGSNYQNGYNGPSNQYGAPFEGNQPSNQYGAPFGGNQHSNQHEGQYGNGNTGSATSSVMIKDFSGPGTPYSTGSDNAGSYGHGGNGHSTDINHGNHGNSYDSYANGDFGSRRPSTAYGAP